MRTGVGLNAALHAALLHGYKSLGSRRRQMVLCAGALHEIVLSVQMQTQGRMLSLSQQSPHRGSAKPSVLVTGAGSESSYGIYILAQGGIFVQSLSEHWSLGVVSKTWL